MGCCPGSRDSIPSSGPIAPPSSGRHLFLEVAQMLRDQGTESRAQGSAGKAHSQQGIPTPSAALARNPPSNARRLHVRALRHEPWRSGFDPELSPSYDLGRRISDAFRTIVGRSSAMLGLRRTLIAENSWTGRPAGRVVCGAGNRFSSPGARVRRKEAGHRDTATERKATLSGFAAQAPYQSFYTEVKP